MTDTLIQQIIQKLAILEKRVDNMVKPEVAANPVGGTGTTPQVAYWTAAKTLGGDPGLTYDAVNNYLDVGARVRAQADTNTYLEWPAADQARIVAGGVTMVDFVEAGTDYTNITPGLLYVNETSNANMTQGITIDQGPNDNEIINLRSSDVAAVWVEVETNTYGTMYKASATAGGLLVAGFRDSDAANSEAFAAWGFLAENADTTKTTAGRAIVEAAGYETDGTDVQNTVANGNVFGVRTFRSGAIVTLMLIDEDADMDLPSGRIATGFGDYWDLEDYHAGAPTADGYVRVDINGTTRHLLTYTP